MKSRKKKKKRPRSREKRKRRNLLKPPSSVRNTPDTNGRLNRHSPNRRRNLRRCTLVQKSLERLRERSGHSGPCGRSRNNYCCDRLGAWTGHPIRHFRNRINASFFVESVPEVLPGCHGCSRNSPLLTPASQRTLGVFDSTWNRYSRSRLSSRSVLCLQPGCLGCSFHSYHPNRLHTP